MLVKNAGSNRGAISAGAVNCDAAIARNFSDALLHDLEPPPNILDLTAVPYWDSSGLGMVMTHFARCKNRGVKMVVVGASAHVLELMRLTKMDRIIPLAESVEAAQLS